jgi:peptide/nickel transport system substrate-binding protein
MLGRGGGTTDPQPLMDPVLHSPDEKSQKGGTNNGRFSDPELDRLIDAAGIDMDVERRGALIAEVQRRAASRFYYVPIHRQMLTRVSRAGVKPVVMPDNAVRLQWIQID